jgi:hypothetical protein
MTITVESFDGHDLNSATVHAWLDMGDSPFARESSPIVHRAPGRNPVHVRSDPHERLVVVHVEVAPGANINDTQRTLQGWFAPGTEGAFVITEDGVEKALDCVVTRFQRYAGSAVEFTASLIAYTPEWRSSALVTTAASIISSGQEFTLTNAGDAPSRDAIITISPETAKAAADGWRYRTRFIIAPRTDSPHVNRAFDITDGGWDHAALVAAGKSNSDGSDIRVLWNGVEQRKFWFGEHADNDANSALTKIWTAASFGGQRTAELLAAITSADPADGSDLEVVRDGIRNFADLPSGAVLVDSEVILFTGTTQRNADGHAAFTGVTRAAWGSTAAAHAAGATVRWIAGFWDVLYGYSNAVTAYSQADLDGKPMLDLTSSTLSNVRREWLDFADSERETRSETWRHRRRALDGQYDRILAPRGSPLAALTFEYQKDGAEADKPNFNEYWLDFPSGTGDDGSGNVLALNRTVDDTMALIARMVDEEGAESVLATYSGALTAASVNIAEPATPAIELSFQGRSQVVWSEGADALTPGSTIINDSGSTIRQGAQSLVAPGAGTWSKTRVRVNHPNVGQQLRLLIKRDINGEPTLTYESGITSGVSHAMSGHTGFEDVEFDHGDLALFAGITYWVTLHVDAGLIIGSGTLNWQHRPGPRPDSQLLHGTTAPAWVEESNRAYLQVISTDCEDFDEFAAADDGDTALVSSLTVHLDSAGVPLLLALPEEEVYVFEGAFLWSHETGQRVTLRHVVCSLLDEIEIDVHARSVVNVTTGEELGAGVEFSEPDQVLEVLPGANTWSFHDEGVAQVALTVTHYSRYV